MCLNADEFLFSWTLPCHDWFWSFPAISASFRRINVRDLYKRLGISMEASENEIEEARNLLVQKYAGHKPSWMQLNLHMTKFSGKTYRAKEARNSLSSKRKVCLEL